MPTVIMCDSGLLLSTITWPMTQMKINRIGLYKFGPTPHSEALKIKDHTPYLGSIKELILFKGA